MNSSHGEFSTLLRRLRLDPQEMAREAARAGQRVVGYVGNDVPVALILAAGALPVRVRVAAGSDDRAVDEFVEASFTPELRAIAAQWMGGALDHLDAVVFSRADDSGQRLYYYLCELQRRGLCRGPRPLLYDVASLGRASSAEYSLESTRSLATQLGTVVARLEPALQRVREREGLLAAVKARRQLPAPLPGSAAWLFDHAAACDWRDAFDEPARRWLDAAALLPIPRRVMLAGDPLPDEQIHTAIEACGASVVLELTETSAARTGNGRDPLAAIAAEFQRRESPAIAMRSNARWLADCALEQRADAVVVWLSEQDEALPWEIARQSGSLRDAGLPVLLLARQPWRVSAAVITQVMHFVRNAGKKP